ncbi:MAG: LmeA family phospholipid-binding protein [Pseudanabaenaceae cyanobacterium]
MTAVVRSLLPPLVELWLRSQVEASQTIRIELQGSDGQIWRGHIPYAAIAGKEIVYQGLHFAHVRLQAHNIRVNTAAALKGTAFRLLAPLLVELEVKLSPTGFQQSWRSPLVQQGLKDLLGTAGEPPTTDTDIAAALTQLLEAVPEVQRVDTVTVENGACHCRGLLAIAAT